MKTLTATERAFVISILDRSRYFNARPTCFNTRHVVIETRLGYHDVKRYNDLFNLGEPKKSGSRWRTRLKGTRAELLLGELLPELTGRAREHAEFALSRVHADETFPPRVEGA